MKNENAIEIQQVIDRLQKANEVEREAFIFHLLGYLKSGAEDLNITKHTVNGIKSASVYLTQ